MGHRSVLYTHGEYLGVISGMVRIYDSQGSLLSEEPVEYMTQHLQVANLRSGLYIIHVQKNDIVRTTKLLLK